MMFDVAARNLSPVNFVYELWLFIQNHKWSQVLVLGNKTLLIIREETINLLFYVIIS